MKNKTKNILSIIFLFLVQTSFSQGLTTEDYKIISSKFESIGVKGITSSVKSSYDNHNDIYSILSSELPIGNSTIQFSYSLYKDGDSIKRSPVMVKVYYNSENWIFLEDISFTYSKPLDAQNAELKRTSLTLKSISRDVNTSATITEYSVGYCSNDLLDFFKQILNDPKTVSVRFTGDSKYVDYNVSGSKIVKETKYFFESVDLFNY